MRREFEGGGAVDWYALRSHSGELWFDSVHFLFLSSFSFSNPSPVFHP